MSADKFKELDVVTLRQAYRALPAGMSGTVLEVFTKPTPAYLVEFSNDMGETLEMPVLTDADLVAWVPAPIG